MLISIWIIAIVVCGRVIMPGDKPYQAKYGKKQWFAIKDKMKKAGSWRDDYNKEQQQRGIKRSGEPIQDRLKIREVDDPAERQNVEDIFNSIEAGKSNLMSDNEFNSECNLSNGNNSTTSKRKHGEISKTDSMHSQIYVESESDSGSEKSCCEFSFLHKRGDSCSKVRKVNEPHKTNEISSRTGQSGGTTRVSNLKEGIRSLILLGKDETNCSMLFRTWVEERGTMEEFETLQGYFQSFNSIGVVIKCLPGSDHNTGKMFQELCKHIKDPFVLISELSSNKVYHWHMIWLTSKRTDNAKRMLQKILDNVQDNLSIACQQTKNFKNLLSYILKEPITLGVSGNDQLMDYCAQILLNKPYEKKCTEGNPIVNEILTCMRKYQAYNYEELLHKCPDIMVKYLHKPNLESIINNCKLFLLKPGNVISIMDRIFTKWEAAPFFRIWAFLEHQGVNAGNFILDLWNIFFKITDKINVICIQGPSNAGKTTFIRPLLELFSFGEVVSGGVFMFQNCINKELLIWEEPLIGSDFVEMCKRVFEGMSTQVPVKYRAPQTLHRTPILITTNKDIWHYCSADEEALRNRMVHYIFSSAASMFRERTAGWFRKSFRSYCEFIGASCDYVEQYQQDSTTRIKCTGSTTSSGVCGTSEHLYSRSSIGSEDTTRGEQVGSRSCNEFTERVCIITKKFTN